MRSCCRLVLGCLPDWVCSGCALLFHSEAGVWTLMCGIDSRHAVDDGQVERGWTKFVCEPVHTTYLAVSQQQSCLVLFALVFPSALYGSLYWDGVEGRGWEASCGGLLWASDTF